MGALIADIYDPSWVDLWGTAPPPDVEVASWSYHLPLHDGIRGVAASYTAALRFDPCAYCGNRPTGGHNELDHIDPRSLGGHDTADNRAGACTACNRQKRSTPLLPFLLEATA